MDLIERGIRRAVFAFLCAVFGSLASGAALGGEGVWTSSSSTVSGAVIVDPATGEAYAPGDAYAPGGPVLYKSADGGASWVALALPRPVSCIGFCSVAPLTTGPAGTVYATVGYGGNGSSTGLLYVSRDAGSNWTLLSQDSPSETYDALVVDPFATSTLYRLGRSGGYFGALLRSTDGGSTWSGIGPGEPGTSSTIAFALDPRNPGVIDAATATALTAPPAPSTGSVYKSSDGGSSWSLLGSGPPLGLLAVDPFSSSTLYAAVSLTRGNSPGLSRSDDGGATFRSIAAIVPNEVLLDPNRRNRIYLSTSDQGVQTSADGGATWATLGSGLPAGGVAALALDPTRQLLYAATYTGVFEISLGGLTLDAAHPFSISLAATDQRTGRTGPGVGTQVNDLWGYFSIPAITNNPDNPEVFVKLLDGTPVNGRYWFFYGGLTDLEYTLTVKDVATGATKTYTKPAGSECGGSDTAAFTP